MLFRSNTFGLAIILYTILIKAITFPLNNSALRSNAMMQLVSPKVKQIQAKYANDKETMNRMMLRLYDDTGINPLGGCLPAIIQLPIFISLYRAINRLAEKDQHFQEPFLWIPNLAGPVAAGQPSLDWLLKSSSSMRHSQLQSASLFSVSSLRVFSIWSSILRRGLTESRGSQPCFLANSPANKSNRR